MFSGHLCAQWRKVSVFSIRYCSLKFLGLAAQERRRDFRFSRLSRPILPQDPSLTGEAAVPLLLSPKAASHANPSLRFDVVTLQSTETTTFTKGYGKHAGRAGPVLLLTDDGERRVSGESLGRFPSGLDLGPEGREVRWFSEREMLRLHGFPDEFNFPLGLTLRQRCALIGNSVNVEVVELLLRRMLGREEKHEQFDQGVRGAPGVAAAVTVES